MNIAFERENKPGHIWLQGIGWRPAVKASELKPGDVTVWNYGATETVKSVTVSKTGKMITMSIVAESGWKGTRKLKADRLVGISA